MSNQLEHCSICDDPTGRAGIGDDSIFYLDDEIGPLCEECNRKLQGEVDERLTARVETLEARCEAFDKLVTCYRLHKQPSDKVLDTLAATRVAAKPPLDQLEPPC